MCLSLMKVEKVDHWCGVADDTGDILIYKVLTNNTQQLINVSDIHPCSGRPNLRADFGNSSSSLLGETTDILLEPGEPENETKAHNLTMGDPRDVVIDFCFKIHQILSQIMIMKLSLFIHGMRIPVGLIRKKNYLNSHLLNS